MKKLSVHLKKLETAVAAVCLVSSTLLIFLAAVARSISQPINWSLDISLFLFAWSTFLSADVAFRNDKLVSVDLLVEHLPERARAALKVGLYLLILVFLALLAGFGAKLAYTSRQRAFQGIPAFSYTWITLSLPFGAALLMQTTVGKLWRLLSKRGADATEASDGDE